LGDKNKPWAGCVASALVLGEGAGPGVAFAMGIRRWGVELW
jgi:hypothetical protein